MAKRSLIIFCTLTLLLSLIMPILPLQGEEEVYENTLRLHVLANSDSEEDQCLKLKVRDRILELLAAKLENVTEREEAVKIIEENKAQILSCVKNEIADQGYDYAADITLTKELYPAKEYEGVTLPSGEYLSLRVLIGNAEGQNWWCVLFPALCTSSAKPEKKLKAAGFTSEQIKILTEGDSPKYKLRFKILEIFNKF